VSISTGGQGSIAAPAGLVLISVKSNRPAVVRSSGDARPALTRPASSAMPPCFKSYVTGGVCAMLIIGAGNII
jgi:hypothetical protein